MQEVTALKAAKAVAERSRPAREGGSFNGVEGMDAEWVLRTKGIIMLCRIVSVVCGTRGWTKRTEVHSGT